MTKPLRHQDKLIQVADILYALDKSTKLHVMWAWPPIQSGDNAELEISTPDFAAFKAAVGWPEFTLHGTTIKVLINPALVESITRRNVRFKNGREIILNETPEAIASDLEDFALPVSAYDVWLSIDGNEGSEADFINSLKAPEAPADGKPYVRINGRWELLTDHVTLDGGAGGGGEE